MPASGGTAIQLTRNGGIAASEGGDGFLYYARAVQSPTSIWRMPVTGGPETLVVEGLSYSANFAVGDRGLYFVSRGESIYDAAVEYLRVRLPGRAPGWRVLAAGAGGTAWRSVQTSNGSCTRWSRA